MLKINSILSRYDLSKCIFLGSGCEGSVYLTKEGAALKIFKKKKSAQHEYDILTQVEGSRFFPKVFEYEENCMLREFVDGVDLKTYLSTYVLSKEVALNLMDMVEEFRELGFTRLDIGSRHIFVQKDRSVKIIDPRKTYSKKQPCPVNLIRALYKTDQLDDFLRYMMSCRPKLVSLWFENGVIVLKS